MAEIGRIYTGKVVRITDFGAFVEFLPGQDGLVHISQLADFRVASVEDVVQVGDEIMVMVIDIDARGQGPAVAPGRAGGLDAPKRPASATVRPAAVADAAVMIAAAETAAGARASLVKRGRNGRAANNVAYGRRASSRRPTSCRDVMP